MDQSYYTLYKAIIFKDSVNQLYQLRLRLDFLKCDPINYIAKILFLLNDSLKYKKLINVLVDSNIRVNILEGYTDILINIIN